MCSFSPYQTTAQNMQEVLDRDTEQRANQGTKSLISQRIIPEGEPGSGVCKYAAQFTYADGSVETLWGV